MNSLRVKQVFIDNDTRTVKEDHVIYFKGGDYVGTLQEPEGEYDYSIDHVDESSISGSVSPFEKVIKVAPGTYSAEEYAANLEKWIKTYLTIAELSYPVKSSASVKYDKAVNKFFIEFDNKSNLTYSISGSQVFEEFFGLETNALMQFRPYRLTGLFATNHAVVFPRYYRICSNSLVPFGYAYDNFFRSNTIAVIPVDYSKSYTYYENNDDFFTYSVNDNSLANVIDISVHAEEGLTPLVAPNFAITFQMTHKH